MFLMKTFNAVSAWDSICTHGGQLEGVQMIANFLTREAWTSALALLLMARIINDRLQQLFFRSFYRCLLLFSSLTDLFSPRELNNNPAQ